MQKPASQETHQSPPATGPDAESPRSSDSSSLSRGLRETIEAIAIAFALAFLFKTFEAEAFVIPTGSMAPTLMGRHKDVVCPECHFRYSASGSEEADRNGVVKNDPGSQVIGCTCPICRFEMSVDPREPAGTANPSYSGDRIWVSKVPYHLMEPRRWDVIVFRYPEEAETYYIKRLVGLPNETVRISHGDIYSKGADAAEFTIERKPPEKVRAMAQVVHDNDFVCQELVDYGWPLRWQAGGSEQAAGAWKVSQDTRSYSTDGTGDETWIRYRHTVPGHWDDETLPRGPARPQLITDFYAFNTRVLRGRPYSEPSALGLHWVGDLILECELDIESAQGTVLLDLVKGGRHFRCAIDAASGETELSIVGLPDWRRVASTKVRGPGKYRVMFANADRQLLVWVNDKPVSFDEPATYDDLGNDRPQSSAADEGDLAPLGIGARGARLTVNHLRVLRDIYYIADTHHFGSPITDYRFPESPVPQKHSGELADFFASPEQWQTARGDNLFDARQPVEFELGKDQFFVLGDNSPASSDARLWSKQHYVERDLLVGKALFVYWPHPLNLQIPFTDASIGVIPNIPGMGFIR